MDTFFLSRHNVIMERFIAWDKKLQFDASHREKKMLKSSRDKSEYACRTGKKRREDPS